MVETVLTPAHPDPLESLLDEPFTGTFDHATAQRQVQGLVRCIVYALPVLFRIHIHGAHSVPCRGGEALDLQGVGQVCQHPIWIAMPQTVPCLVEPPPRMPRPSVQPGGSPLPRLLHGVVKIQDPCGIGGEALLKPLPQAPRTITEPDHLGGTADALAQGFKPQTPLERNVITEVLQSMS